jgi:acyl dehydratase
MSAPIRSFAGVTELEAAVGTHLGFSSWHTVTQDQIDQFADVTGDHQWIHVDPNRATAGPFGQTIAHGFLTLSLLPRLTAQVYEITGAGMAVNYGADRVRFPAPVRVNSRIRAAVELTAVLPKGNGHQIASRVTIEVDGSPTPACVIDMLAVVAP